METFETVKVFENMKSVFARFYVTVKTRQCWRYGLSREFIRVGTGRTFLIKTVEVKKENFCGFAKEIWPKSRMFGFSAPKISFHASVSSTYPAQKKKKGYW